MGKIEEQNTKVAIDFRNPKITIEHIMPQTLNNDWENKLGKDYDSVHTRHLDNIGNLILTEFNSEMGNKSFAEKKKKLHTASLNYRLSVINKTVWVCRKQCFFANRNFDFEFILNNQNEIFRKNDIIVKLAALKPLIHENSDPSSRYKSFDGKTWDKMDNLFNNDTFFIHVNISATSYVNRMANVMNEFSMDEQSVQVKLKQHQKHTAKPFFKPYLFICITFAAPNTKK